MESDVYRDCKRAVINHLRSSVSYFYLRGPLTGHNVKPIIQRQIPLFYKQIINQSKRSLPGGDINAYQ
ncbi:hypothetical protein [Pantoea anthophila]|uniref:Uncharacterized protein n=1 Tax=Pantoea anthophila TaxID=470931 RepID=A0ABY2ZD17_9GAMM|nr:hypothetical protein [Pantoea anthophila]TPV28398.1 hypothetical protein FJW00_09670 [Pantoea anthophila]